MPEQTGVFSWVGGGVKRLAGAFLVLARPKRGKQGVQSYLNVYTLAPILLHRSIILSKNTSRHRASRQASSKIRNMCYSIEIIRNLQFWSLSLPA